MKNETKEVDHLRYAHAFLTTHDNPYDPRTNYDQWDIYDRSLGHNTTNYIARLCNIPLDSTDEEYATARDNAIKYIVDNDLDGLYKILFPKNETPSTVI